MHQTSDAAYASTSTPWMIKFLVAISRLDRVAMAMLRTALVLVLVWIGGLKFVDCRG